MSIISWDWDLSRQCAAHGCLCHAPQHTYAVAGTYTVILKMTVLIAGVPTVFTSDPYKITVGHWMPDIQVKDCGDGTVVYKTNAPSDESGKHFVASAPGASLPPALIWHQHLHRHKAKVRVCTIRRV